MINKDTKICACNDLTAGDIAKCIRTNNFKTLEELLDNEVCPMGDKCESCRDEGINNDGINIPLVLKMVNNQEL